MNPITKEIVGKPYTDPFGDAPKSAGEYRLPDAYYNQFTDPQDVRVKVAQQFDRRPAARAAFDPSRIDMKEPKMWDAVGQYHPSIDRISLSRNSYDSISANIPVHEFEHRAQYLSGLNTRFPEPTVYIGDYRNMNYTNMGPVWRAQIEQDALSPNSWEGAYFDRQRSALDDWGLRKEALKGNQIMSDGKGGLRYAYGVNYTPIDATRFYYDGIPQHPELSRLDDLAEEHYRFGKAPPEGSYSPSPNYLYRQQEPRNPLMERVMDKSLKNRILTTLQYYNPFK